MQRLLPVVFLTGLMAVAGCVPQSRLIQAEETLTHQYAEMDSLRAEQAELAQLNDVLRDSLQFLDDIESGQYYRDMNKLRNRIQRLEYDLAVAADGGVTVEIISTDDLFKPSSAELTETGQGKLDDLAAHLEEEFPDQVIRIEGHSDSVPVGASMKEKYPSNWELSGARASAVVRYLIEAHDITPERLYVVAFSASKPISSNASAEGRRQNRRIRIAAFPTVKKETAKDSASKQ